MKNKLGIWQNFLDLPDILTLLVLLSDLHFGEKSFTNKNEQILPSFRSC